jgi:hypothetical protein
MEDMIGSQKGGEPQADPVALLPMAVVALDEPTVEPKAASSRKRRPRAVLVIGLIAILLVALGVGGVIANAALSQAYGPERALQDYFTAQSHRNVDGMMANATFVRGDGSFADLFGKGALIAMMRLPANSDIRNLRVTSVREIDSAARSVAVSMSWGGKARNLSFLVRKDPIATHWLVYPSWKVEIPSTRITLQLPNQAGALSIDGLLAPFGSERSSIQTIMGFHRISTVLTPLVKGDSQDVDAVNSNPTATLRGDLTEPAISSAAATVKKFLTTDCDPAKYDFCFNHLYRAPDNKYIYYFKVPGYGDVNYTTYKVDLVNDPAADMKLTLLTEPGKVEVSGTCRSTLTVDGSKKYTLKGDLRGTLTWGGSDFGYDLHSNCVRERA